MADKIQGLPEGAELRPIQGLPEGAELRPLNTQQEQPESFDPNLTSRLSEVGQAGKEALQGAGAGVLHSVQGISGLLNKIPLVGETLAPKEGVRAMTPLATPPASTPGQVGYAGEQLGEMLAPGAGEEVAAGRLAEAIPAAGRFAEPLAKIATSAGSTGAINKIQGGDFTTGALAGGGGEVAAEAGKAFAPKLAETALRVTAPIRGKNPEFGKTVLEETSGIRPATIAREAGDKAHALTGEMEQGVHAATATGATGSTSPAHQALSDFEAKTPRNATEVADALDELREKLAFRGEPGGSAPKGAAKVAGPARINYSPDELLELKRGIGKTIASWPPEWKQTGDAAKAQKALYGAIDSELDRIVPGNAQVNDRIHKLIPIQDRAQEVAAHAPISQQIAERVARPTGALIGGIAGEEAGRRQFGTPGAIAGGALGLAAPAILSSSAAEMLGARVLKNGFPARVIPKSILQMARRANPEENPDNR